MSVSDDDELIQSLGRLLDDVDDRAETWPHDNWLGPTERDLIDVQQDSGGYGTERGTGWGGGTKWDGIGPRGIFPLPRPNRPRRIKVRQRDGSYLTETVTLTKPEHDRRKLLDERDEMLGKALSELSSKQARRFLRRLAKKRVNPSRSLKADDPTKQAALDEAVAAWRRLEAAWRLISPVCETPNCPRLAKHHSVPKRRPKIHRESCDPCNQYFRNHGVWPTYPEAHKDNP